MDYKPEPSPDLGWVDELHEWVFLHVCLIILNNLMKFLKVLDIFIRRIMRSFSKELHMKISQFCACAFFLNILFASA